MNKKEKQKFNKALRSLAEKNVTSAMQYKRHFMRIENASKWQSQRIIQIITKTAKLTEMVSKSQGRPGTNPPLA